MRSLLTLTALLSLSLLTVSCSSKSVNDAKVSAAKKAGDAVEKELKEAFASVSIENVDCNVEAKKIGGKVEEKVADLLKVKTEVNKSFASAVVPQVCSFVINSVFPELVNKVDTEYVCLKQLGSDKLKKVGTDLCNGLDL